MSEPPALARDLSLAELVLYGVGLILGAGIYAIVGEAAGAAGESVPLAFVAAAIAASFTGVSYAELASQFPRGEGDYVYVREAFDNKRLAEVTALLRLFVGVVSAAAVAIAFGGYLTTFLDTRVVTAGIAVVVVASVVNAVGIDLSAKLNVVFTTAEIAGLVIVVWYGIGSWGTVSVTGGDPAGIARATFLAFFAYLGFGSIVTVAEETRDPVRTVPRAILLAVALTTVAYVAVAVSAVALVEPAALAASRSPLALVVRASGGPTIAGVVGVIALVATANTVLLLLVSTSRLVYGVSKTEYRSFPAVFAHVDPRRRTPTRAVALVGLLTVPVVTLGDLALVAGLTNAALLVVFLLVNAAAFRLRLDRPAPAGVFRAPGVGRFSVTAVCGFACSLLLLVVFVDGLV